jgi:hypothetical protein
MADKYERLRFLIPPLNFKVHIPFLPLILLTGRFPRPVSFFNLAGDITRVRKEHKQMQSPARRSISGSGYPRQAD